MSSSSGAGGGGPIRRRSGRLAAKCGGTSVAPELHGPLHELHHAIERNTANFDHVQKLLDMGHTFCKGDGLNCFVLAASKWAFSADSKTWNLLMKMLQIDSRGILARDLNGSSLLMYFRKDVDKTKQLIELGVNLNNVDNAGKTLIQSLFSYDVFSSYDRSYISNYVQVWDMLLEHQEIQNQVTKGAFFNELVQAPKRNSLARKLFCNLIQKGLMRVEELEAQLEMHPLFFIIQLNCRESLQLLLYIWGNDPDKKENVVKLGADLNVVDNKGKSLLECLFNSEMLLMYNYYTEPLALELWKVLIQHSEIQRQASEGYFRSIAPLAKKSYLLNSDLAKDIFLKNFQLGLLSVEKLTLELQMHPLFFALMLASGEPSGVLSVLKSYPDFLKDKTILVTENLTKHKIECPHGFDPSTSGWKKVKSVLNIPDMVTFDVLGYILFTLKLSYTQNNNSVDVESSENQVMLQCLTTLLNDGFVPSKTAGVVHPIHALLYNFTIKSKKIIYVDRSTGRLWSQQKNLPNVLLKIISTFKDFPVPHKLVQDPETGSLMLDVHLLMSSMVCPAVVRDFSANKILLFEIIMGMLQLSPCHPLQHFATFYKYSSCYFEDMYQPSKELCIETFCKLLRLTLEASGSHKFQGVDQSTIECISNFCESVQNFSHFREAEEIILHRKAAIRAESEVGSLKWLSILQVRKTLFLNRSNTTDTLPSLIKGLFAEGRLPKGLEADLLVYKPNNCINF